MKDAITDTVGQFLDGDAGGVIGGNNVRAFSVGSPAKVALWGQSYSSTPTFPIENTDFVRIAHGDSHTLGLKADGTVWAWGGNTHGQLGNGTTTSSGIPVQVSGLTGVTEIAGGFYHSLALLSDGTVRSWGYNFLGQLGDGTQANRTTPVAVTGLTGVTAIAVGGHHSLALLSDGTVQSWGYNVVGQLGDGTTTDRTTPVTVSGLSGVTAIAGGFYHSLALLSDGTVRGWGHNGVGQLGDGTQTTRTTPVAVSGLASVTAIEAKSYHSLALRSDGTVRGWGYNSYGQLGDGTTTLRATPVTVSGLAGVTAIASGYDHSVALLSNGTLRSWGRNSSGQLGDSTTTSRTTPVAVAGLSSVTAISAGGSVTTAFVAPLTQALPVVEFSAPTASGAEGATANLPRLLVNGTVIGAQNVDVTITGGSATLGTDFTLTTTIDIPAGTYDGTAGSSVAIPLSILGDFVYESTEDIQLTLLHPTTGVSLGDANGNTVTAVQHTYQILNVEHAPTNITLSNATINENLPVGTTIGTLSAVDPDTGDFVTFTPAVGIGDDDNASFLVVGNSLVTNASFNFESKSSYSIRVRSIDQGGLWFEQTFTIDVTDVNESPPSSLTLSNTVVSSNALPGTSIGQFTTTDPDARDSFTWSLISGTGDEDNARFQIVGNVLMSASAFDYSLQNSFSIRVRTSDQVGHSFEDSFNISLVQGVATVVEDLIPGGGINGTNRSSSPSQMINVSGMTYFVADDGVNGVELWRIGSSGVAEVVEDGVAGGGINPGSSSSSPSVLTNVNGRLYFRADDGTNGVELWRINSSGVAELVEDSIAGGGIRSGSSSSVPTNLTDVNATLYFSASDGINGAELWRINSSGVAELVEDSVAGGGIRPGSTSSSPAVLTNVNGTLYFSVNGLELWRINSSGVAETVPSTIAGGAVNPGLLTNVNGTLYFRAFDNVNGTELWRINSSGAAEIVEDAIAGGGINPGISGSYPSYLTNINGTLYFSASNTANGTELWRINSSGLAELAEDSIAGGGINPGSSGSSPSNLTNVNGTLYFSASNSVNGLELWRINSSGVAELVEDSVVGGGINPGSSNSSPINLTNVNGTLYFVASDSVNGLELWRINHSGVAELVEDAVAGGGINPGITGSNPGSLTNVNGTLCFLANDGSNGTELWRINSSGVAELVEDAVAGGGISPGSTGSNPLFLTNANGTLYFVVTDAANGTELWRINNSGVAVVVEDVVSGGGINSVSSGASPSRLTNVNGTLYFVANDGVNGAELWRIGSSGAAELVEDAVAGGGINPGSSGSSPSYLTNVNGTLYFSANDGVTGTELWRINSSGLAELVEDSIAGGGINPGNGSSGPSNLTNVNGTLYFSASDSVNGRELWRVNNTGVAELVEDSVAGGGINPGFYSSDPAYLTNMNGTLYFRASNSVNGFELWRINSSGAAEQVEDSVAGGGINPGFSSSYPRYLTNVNGTLYFQALDNVNGAELWRINGAGVAELVEDSIAGGGINPGSSNSSPSALTNVNGTLYFSASNTLNGLELWRINSSGAAELVEDSVAGGGINPGSSNSNPGVLTNVSGTLYFRAFDNVNGYELWRINGSGVAELVEDSLVGGGIFPGTSNSSPDYLTNVNGTLYFRANDGVNGFELWRINSSGVAELVEDSIAGGGISPGINGSNPRFLRNVNGTLYFPAGNEVNGVELWRINSSGVAEMVEDAAAGGGLFAGAGSSSPSEMISVGGKLYFVADDGFFNGHELWVLALNATPTDLTLSQQTLAENQPASTTIGTFTTTDPDAGDSFTYTLVSGSGDTDNGSFTISGSTLQAAVSFDFESRSSYSIRVRTTDQGGFSFEKIFTITVINTNEVPSFIVGSNQVVLEDAGAQTVPSVTSGSKIYWVNNSSKTIQRSSLDGMNVEDVYTIATASHNFSDIEVDLAGGKIYWSETYAFRRANLDGSNVETLLDAFVNSSVRIPAKFIVEVLPGSWTTGLAIH